VELGGSDRHVIYRIGENDVSIFTIPACLPVGILLLLCCGVHLYDSTLVCSNDDPCFEQ